MRTIKYIVVHCTAGPLHQSTAEILNYWRKSLGWTNPGYHEMISADGSFESLFPIEKPSNGVKGYNAESIHICCKGGVDAKGNPIDNRTVEQKKTLQSRLIYYKTKFRNAVILGHRDFSTDKNGNGLIDQWELIKACPGYDVRDWLREIGMEEVAKPSGIVYKENYPLIKDAFVSVIQHRLKSLEYKVEVDSYFGEQTAKAVKQFQLHNKLPATGIADNLTISVLGIR